jgi:hypothetical protein
VSSVAKPVHAAIGEMKIRCAICEGDRFREREVKLNSFGLQVLKMGWADESGTALICWRCGYVHTFVNRNIDLYRAEK